MSDTLLLFVSAFAVSGLAGLAALLRSGAPLRVLGICSSVLNGGLLGMGLSMVWLESFRETPHVLVGLCILLGLGGVPTLEFILGLLRRGGLTIRVGDGSASLEGPPDAKDEVKRDTQQTGDEK